MNLITKLNKKKTRCGSGLGRLANQGKGSLRVGLWVSLWIRYGSVTRSNRVLGHFSTRSGRGSGPLGTMCG